MMSNSHKQQDADPLRDPTERNDPPLPESADDVTEPGLAPQMDHKPSSV